MPSGNLLILLMLSWGVVPVLLGQSQDPVLRVESNLVLVDFVSGDESGQPILGLTSKDLTILEDGKHREITFFQLINYGQDVSLGNAAENHCHFDKPRRLAR